MDRIAEALAEPRALVETRRNVHDHRRPDSTAA
jgi:hypothetical protein